MNSPLFVSASTTLEVLQWREMIDALAAAYAVEHTPATSPRRIVTRGPDTWFRALAASSPTGSYMGAKLFGLSRTKSVTYLIALFDQQSGEIAALIDAKEITALRTGATSAVAADRLAPQRPLKVGILGSGIEARAHLQALAAIRQVSSFSVFSPSPNNRQRFADEMASTICVPGHAAADPAAALADADLVVGATMPPRGGAPTLRGDWVRDDAIVLSIGATLPEHLEADERMIEKADLIVCDAPEEVTEETGDFIAMRKAGRPYQNKIVSLNDLMLGKADDRARTAKAVMYKSVGAGIQDIAVAELAYRKAKERGGAEALPIEFVLRT